jgi:glycosyltransferase involved in cell wall biosynthesis
MEDYKDVDRTNAEYITLINHNENKGGQILIEIAKQMPERKFLAVQGGYYKQIFSKLPNIKYVPLADDIRPYLAQTKILIAPSEYESYGQAQVEAMCCGIPVIATDLPGLREAVKDGRFVADRNNISHWVEAIKQVESIYGLACFASTNRAYELTPKKDLSNFAIWLEKIFNLAIKTK